MTVFTGTASLVRLVLRRDRIRLPVWILAIVGLVQASAQAVADAYSTQAQIDTYAATMGSSPAAVAMGGPPVGLRTLGGIVVYETSITALVATGLMAVFLVVRHTRAEEEQGRTELLRSAVVGRHAPTAAALMVVWSACVLVGLGVVLALVSVELPASDAIVFGASVAAAGLVFAAVAACAAQLMTHARGAVGLSSAVLGAAFVLRAAGDVGNGRLSWASPLGWSQATRPFADQRWWPLAISLTVSLLLVALALWLATRRDLGLGLVAPRPGPAHASASLRGPAGLALRLQRGSIVGWATGIFLGGFAFGSLSRELETMVESNPTFAEYFAAAGGTSLVDSFFAVALLLLALIGTGFAVSSVLRIRAEETSGRLEPILATGVSRTSLLAGNLLVTLVGTGVVVAAGGLGVGIAQALVSDEPGSVGRMLGYGLVHLPAVLVLAALAVVLVGWAPRAVALCWSALAVCFVVAWLGGLLPIPAWVEAASPFTHTPQAPAEAVSAGPLVALGMLAATGVAAGLAGFRRRDVGA
jgi:ABC-2 type transport system permease protein